MQNVITDKEFFFNIKKPYTLGKSYNAASDIDKWDCILEDVIIQNSENSSLGNETKSAV